jgi:hypothetical protein
MTKKSEANSGFDGVSLFAVFAYPLSRMVFDKPVAIAIASTALVIMIILELPAQARRNPLRVLALLVFAVPAFYLAVSGISRYAMS